MRRVLDVSPPGRHGEGDGSEQQHAETLLGCGVGAEKRKQQEKRKKRRDADYGDSDTGRETPGRLSVLAASDNDVVVFRISYGQRRCPISSGRSAFIAPLETIDPAIVATRPSKGHDCPLVSRGG